MDFSDSSDSQVKRSLRFSDEYHETVFDEYRLTMEQLKMDLGDLGKDRDILDFGCANGVFLRFLNSRGVSKQHLYGCDISSQMLEEAATHSNNLFHSTEILNYENRFDLVTLWDVLEHIINPKDHIQNIFKSLKHDGKLLIQTPNYGLLAEKFGEDFAHYLVLEHINLFSRKAAIELIESVGFRLVGEGSFGANIEAESCDINTKRALDSIAKSLDFGATQILLFQKNRI
jgi:2-polyprenyl-3-methyl-5-hydroxy-6-metoxy-1,4-benzoquinol methylase